jgi:hypothetical protein
MAISKASECKKVEDAFLKKFGKIPDVRFHDGNFCLWKPNNTMCDGIKYYSLSPFAEYAVKFVEDLLIQIPSAIAVYESPSQKREAILQEYQAEMNAVCLKQDVFEE